MKKLNCSTALSIAAIGLIFGAIGPWITVLGFINGGPTNSLEVGLVVFGGIGLVICSAFSGRFMRTVSILVGVLILVEAGHVFYEMHHANGSDIGSLVTPGWGLYLTIIACLWLIASTFVVKAQHTITHVKQVAVGTGKVAFDPYGHCDTCGFPCGPNGCLNNPMHVAAIGDDDLVEYHGGTPGSTYP